jgi:hypothetical protein
MPKETEEEVSSGYVKNVRPYFRDIIVLTNVNLAMGRKEGQKGLSFWR